MVKRRGWTEKKQDVTTNAGDQEGTRSSTAIIKAHRSMAAE